MRQEYSLFFYNTSKYINVFSITLISLLGVFGNSFSIYLLWKKEFTNNFTNTASLAMLALSDIVVLVSHYVDFTFRTWANAFEIHDSIFNFVDKSSVSCKLVYYLRNVFRTISAYVTILIIWERFIVLYFPLKKTRWCSPRTINIFLLIIFMSAFLMNLAIINVVDVVEHTETQYTYCDTLESNQHFQFALSLLLVLVTIIIPMVLITIFCFMLLRKLTSYVPFSQIFCSCQGNPENESIYKPMNSCENLSKIPTTSGPNVSVPAVRFQKKKSNISYITSNKTALKSTTRLMKKLNNVDQSSEPYKRPAYSIRKTYFTIVLSKWFILLHLPYFIFWLIYYVNDKFYGNSINNITMLNNTSYNILLDSMSSYEPVNISNTDLNMYRTYQKTISNHFIIKGLQNYCEILYVSNYAIGFLIYNLSGKVFGSRLKEFFTGQINKCLNN